MLAVKKYLCRCIHKMVAYHVAVLYYQREKRKLERKGSHFLSVCVSVSLCPLSPWRFRESRCEWPEGGQQPQGGESEAGWEGRGWVGGAGAHLVVVLCVAGVTLAVRASLCAVGLQGRRVRLHISAQQPVLPNGPWGPRLHLHVTAHHPPVLLPFEEVGGTWERGRQKEMKGWEREESDLTETDKKIRPFFREMYRQF